MEFFLKDNTMVKNIMLLLFFFSFSACSNSNFTPGKPWFDNNGEVINAHGGGVLKFKDKYYWFGEHKTEGKRGNQAWVGVHCYSSENLYNWKDEGVAFAVSKNPESPVTAGCIIERPKVIYNPKTKKFVMLLKAQLR